MADQTACPLFVDGKKICEATSASYTVDEPVEFNGSGLPGPTKVEKDLPEYLIEAEIPEDIEPGITHESRVEVAFPPSTHGNAGWHVIEVWGIHQIEVGHGELKLAAWQGDIHTGVSYLGDDTDTMTDDEGRIETTPGISMLLDTDSEDSNDEDFQAERHDI